MIEPEYLIRKDGMFEWTVSKWEGGAAPSAVYKVVSTGRGWKCSCHQGKNCTKHPKMVLEFEAKTIAAG